MKTNLECICRFALALTLLSNMTRKLLTMKIIFAKVGGVALLVLALFNSSSAATNSVINITLEDTSTGSGMTDMRITVDQEAVKTGRVTFQAVNRSRTLIHEVIVVKTPAKTTVLPYSEKQARVIESGIRHLGEISDLKPGASGKLTLNLKPGHYLLICNEPGHFKAGMKVSLEVHR
jgi:uncharacterized cupredoxin-like copper-binding protein